MSTSTTHTIRSFLSGRLATALIVFIGIIGRSIQLVYFYNIRFDASYQVIATRQLLAGHGISLPNVVASDLSSTIYTPLIMWPPGYSVMLSPFYALFNQNYIAAGITLDILAAIVLLYFSRKLLRLLNIPIYLINCFTICSSFFIYYFYFIASSDAIAISIFMIAIYYTVSLLQQYNTRKLVFIIAALFGVVFIKYLFIPAAFVIPFFLLVKGMIDKESWLKKAGLISGISLGVLLACVLLYQQSVSGTATYISEPGRGFFPQHLQAAYPFLPASFVNTSTIGQTAGVAYGTGSILYQSLLALHILAACWILALVSWHVRKKGWKKATLTGSFFCLTLLFSVAIAGLLTCLSLMVPKENIKGYWWTYLEEARYYGLLTWLFQLSAIVFYHHYGSTSRMAIRWMIGGLFILLTVECGRGIFFDLQRLLRFNKEEYSWQYEDRFQRQADRIIQQKPGAAWVVAGPAAYMINRVSLYSNVPVLTNATIINHPDSLHTRHPVQLLIVMDKIDQPYYQSFLANPAKELVGSFNGLYFYTLYVAPR